MNERYETLDLRRENGLLWLVLNRPHALNALNRTLIDELHTVLDMLHDDQSIRVVILRGAGRAFCAGLDLKEANAGTTKVKVSVAQGLRDQRRIAELAIKIHHAPQPFIAAVRGPASGGGFALALASDIRLGCLILETFSVSHGKAYPYLPLIDFLKNYFQLVLQDDEPRAVVATTGKTQRGATTDGENLRVVH